MSATPQSRHSTATSSLGSMKDVLPQPTSTTISLRTLIAATCGILVLIMGLIQATLVIPLNNEVISKALDVVNTSSIAAQIELGTLTSETSVAASVIIDNVKLQMGDATSIVPSSGDPTWDYPWHRAFSAAIHRHAPYYFGFIDVNKTALTMEWFLETSNTLEMVRQVMLQTGDKITTYRPENDMDTVKKSIWAGVEEQIRLIDCNNLTTTLGTSPETVANVGVCQVQTTLVEVWLHPVREANAKIGYLLSIIPLETISSVLASAPSVTLYEQRTIVIDRKSGAFIGSNKEHPVVYSVKANAVDVPGDDVPCFRLESANKVNPTELCHYHIQWLKGDLHQFSALASSHSQSVEDGHDAKRVAVDGNDYIVSAWPQRYGSETDWLVIVMAPLDHVATGYRDAVRDSILTTIGVTIACTVCVIIVVYISTAPLKSITREMHRTTNRFRKGQHRRDASRFQEVAAVQETVWHLTDVLAQLRGFLPASVVYDADSTRTADSGNGAAQQQQENRHSSMSSSAGVSTTNKRAAFLLLHLGGCVVYDQDTMEGFRSFQDAMAQTFSNHGGNIEHIDATTTWVSFNCQTPCLMPEEAACRCAIDMAVEIERRNSDDKAGGIGAEAVICVDAYVPHIYEVNAAQIKAKLIDTKRAALLPLLPSIARLHGVRVVVTNDVATAITYQTVILDNLAVAPLNDSTIRLYELQGMRKQSMATDTSQMKTRRAFSQMLVGDYPTAAKSWESVEGPHAKSMFRICKALQRRRFKKPYVRELVSPWGGDELYFCDEEAGENSGVSPSAAVGKVSAPETQNS